MDYKEKYEQAKARMNKWVEGSEITDPKEVAEFVFPELKENEDERIRNFLISKMKEVGNVWKEYSSKDIIAWLEKQGEQKPQGKLALEVWKDIRLEVYQQASGNRHEPNYSDDSTKMFSLTDIDEIFEKIAEKQCEKKPFDYENANIQQKDFVPKGKPKFKAGDWVVPNNGEPRVSRVEERGWPDSIISDSLGNQYVNTFSLDKQYHLWTIKDAKDGDVLVASDGSIFIFKEVVDCGCKHYIALEKDNETINVNDNLEHFWESVRGVKPATKEQRDQLEKAMVNAGYRWNKEELKLEKI